MIIHISHDGTVQHLYCEDMSLVLLGKISIARASHVEPDAAGNWFADLSPIQGPLLGPFAKRSEALAAEVAWLESHTLSGVSK